MERLISEPIEPEPGAFDTAAMSRGEPGLPPSFTWRGLTVRVLEYRCVAHLEIEPGRASCDRPDECEPHASLQYLYRNLG